MEAPLIYDIENETRLKFVTEADWIPGFWNFLLGLDCDDLIAELVQNDLDQDATCTDISFEQDRLVCEGNGKPVDLEGWQRLRKIQGAGNSVPAKRGKIGIKNHGLKTAFTIGDEIRLLSAGQAITQTLYARGRDTAPYPGASPEPEADPQAPVKGCRIIIRYRNADIAPLEGEAVVFRAVGAQSIGALFKSACASTPEQFAGIVSPGVVPRYQIVLRHWHLGEARFVFSCTRPRKPARPTKGIEIFRRRCAVSGTVHSLPADLQEEAVRRLLPLKGSLRQRVADFFRRGNRFFVEVSWPVDGRGKPGTGTGRFRYPIGYPEGSHDARTGHSVFFNAPIVSDTERHGPARNEATNKELREACEMLLVDALARHAIPRWGPDGLNPLVPSPKSNNEDEAVRPLLAKLARRGAMPTLTWRTAARRVLKSKRRKASASARHAAAQQRSGEPRRYRFVTPVASWNPEVIDASLSVISPRSERQLDPRVHRDIVRLLAEENTGGFYEDFITFDENDALDRAIGEGNQYFASCDNPEQEFAQPLIARSYLDVIQAALEHDKCDVGKEDALQEALLLPDTHAEPTRFPILYTSVQLPSDVPGVRLPPILHQDLASHPLFRRAKWRRPKYTMAKFLGSGALQDADEQTRKLFWQWLRQNERRIGPRARAKLANIAIWPDIDGNICKLSDLCDPRSRRVAAILRNSIRRPHEHVRQSRIVTSSKKRRTFIRHIPSQDEISNWLGRRMAPFVPGDMPNVDTVATLDRFEADLTTLLKNSGVARVLREIGITLPALAKDGSIRQRTELVMPSRNNERLALHKRFLLKDNRRATALNKISQALSDPTIAMLLSMFDKDREDFDALQARLHQFLALTEPSDSHRVQLAGMPILPVHGQPHAPRDLAFMGPKGDYWGAWKTRITGKGLSQDDQRRYRDVGVMSSSPTGATSRAFFEWLSQQDAAVLAQHVSCVLRHILHQDGPENWAESFIGTPFIPAKSSGGLRLISLRQARRRPVYLPDAEIAEAVIKKDPRIALVIVKVREIPEPISEPLRRLGVRSLREAIGEPEHVGGSGNIKQATEGFLNRFEALRSRRFRHTFRKRLGALGVESELVRRDWYDRLSRISKIRFADIVEARYRFRRKPYRVAVDAGFDPVSGTFWIKQGHGARLSSLYRAIAAQLVFKLTARLIHLPALELALEMEIHDPSFGHPASATSSSENEQGALDEDYRDGESEAEDDDADPGEAVFGHSPFKPDSLRNVPKSRPIPSAASPATQRRKHWGSNESGSSKGGGGNNPASGPEKKHVEALKLDQYASHCQMCLCERPPQELAPVGSYIEWEEVRRRVVEAHHVDLKSAGGALHAGNLILLCKLHHDNYGRRLTRVAVTAALRDKKKDKVVRFGENNDGNTERKGQAVEILLPDTGEIAAIFFTNEHADYWLSSAP